jgi:succinate-semialdehyde dehydrogenase/glutarate-semialdehyde dehydrogenase
MQTLNLIGEDWTSADSGRTFEVRNPADDSLLATVPECGLQETRRAIEAAENARVHFAALSIPRRSAMLMGISTLLGERREELARTITLEQGKPIAESRDEIEYARGFFEVSAHEAESTLHVAAMKGQPVGKEVLLHATPVGTTAAITPWNFPLAMLAKKLSAALAVGCTQVIKPAEETPLSALAFAELCLDAGLPPGVLNVVTGNPQEIGAEMLRNPIVRKISFTGSSEVGRLIRRNAGTHLPQITLELGGHAPFIVMEGADLEGTVAGAIASKFRNAGQACISPNRFFVQDSIHDEFVTMLIEAAAALRLGNGLEEGVQIGPIFNDEGLAKVERHVTDAMEHGAKCRLGGSRVAIEGLANRFFAPTVLTGCGPEMLCFREETFGPVCPVRSFGSEEEVIREANASPYGLAGYLWCAQHEQGRRIAEQLEVGIVGVNDPSPATPHVPFGGVKESGWGREGSAHALMEYAPVKTISFGPARQCEE